MKKSLIGLTILALVIITTMLSSSRTTSTSDLPSTPPLTYKETAITNDLAKPRLKARHQEYFASKTSYPFESTIYTPVPNGYLPVFINYIGRHGSRHLTGPKYDVTLKKLLDIATESKQITKTGLTLRSEIEALIQIENGHYGKLSELGKKELQNIGTRMFNNFPDLFKNKPSVISQATFKNRAQASRDNFIIGLKMYSQNIEANNTHFEKDADPYLRPFDASPRYIKHKAGKGWEDLYLSYESNGSGSTYSKEILLTLFSEDFYNRLNEGEFELTDNKGKVRLSNPQNAVSSLYTLYAISACLKAESDLDFGKYFNNEQLKWYESVTVVEDFYKKGPSLTTTDITSNIMAPLVKDMINSVEINNESAGVFRFAHAETIIPLATFLELKTANTSTNNPDKVMSIWEIKSISPMAANVQWILYDNGSNKLIKMLYNEVEMSFPVALKPVTGVYYHWADVKDYYTQKIESLGFNMSNTMEEDLDYLKSHY